MGYLHAESLSVRSPLETLLAYSHPPLRPLSRLLLSSLTR
jgi:hypothetical protein